jgi:hypothetical protein
LIAAQVTGEQLQTATLQTVAYQPGSSSWDVLPASGLGAQATGVVAVDGRAILWQPAVDASVEWRSGSRSWSPIAATHAGWAGCFVDVAAVWGVAFSWNCGRPAMFSGVTSTWSTVDLPMTIDRSVVPRGDTVAAEDGFVVKALVPTMDAHGVVESHENHLWFWKPRRPSGP